MKGGSRLEVFMHYPVAEEDKQALRQKVSEVQAEAVIKYISKLTCPLEQKLKLLQAVQEKEKRSEKLTVSFSIYLLIFLQISAII